MTRPREESMRDDDNYSKIWGLASGLMGRGRCFASSENLVDISLRQLQGILPVHKFFIGLPGVCPDTFVRPASAARRSTNCQGFDGFREPSYKTTRAIRTDS